MSNSAQDSRAQEPITVDPQDGTVERLSGIVPAGRTAEAADTIPCPYPMAPYEDETRQSLVPMYAANYPMVVVSERDDGRRLGTLLDAEVVADLGSLLQRLLLVHPWNGATIVVDCRSCPGGPDTLLSWLAAVGPGLKAVFWGEVLRAEHAGISRGFEWSCCSTEATTEDVAMVVRSITP